jgi:TetR/AcrR family transcriptional repressor of nem operon
MWNSQSRPRSRTKGASAASHWPSTSGGAPPSAASGRQPLAVRAVFAEGLDGMIRSVEEALRDGQARRLRDRAINLVTRMVGALMLSRAVPDDSPLADELLGAVLRSALAEAAP